jgi:hypothetical protein
MYLDALESEIDVEKKAIYATYWLQEFIGTNGCSLTLSRLKVLHRLRKWRQLFAEHRECCLILPAEYVDCGGCPWCTDSQSSSSSVLPYFTKKSVPSFMQFCAEFQDIEIDDIRLEAFIAQIPKGNMTAMIQLAQRISNEFMNPGHTGSE